MKIKLLLFFLLTGLASASFAQSSFPFANEIREFNHADSVHRPKSDGILFIGSSSIRKWTDLEQRFSKYPIVRRGVGGCELSQLVKYYTPYILFPYKPRKIFLYAGENDIAAGEKADSVFSNFKDLYAMIRKNLPAVKLYYLSIKYSPSRIKFKNDFVKANELIKEYLADKPNTLFIDMNPSIYKNSSTECDPVLFEGDLLHLNSKGYDRWQKVLEPYVN